MGFNIERTNKPFVVKSPYKPSGDQLRRLKSLRNALKTVKAMWCSWVPLELAKPPPQHGLLNVCNARR